VSSSVLRTGDLKGFWEQAIFSLGFAQEGTSSI